MTKAGFIFSDYIGIHVHMEDTNELDRKTETKSKSIRQECASDEVYFSIIV
jgi:hypothetical protein